MLFSTTFLINKSEGSCHMTNADLEQTGRQLLQLLLQLIPDLWETLTLLVLQFQFLRCGTITLARKQICTVTVFFCCGHAMFCDQVYDTFFAASSCSLRISEPFSRISSEELRSRLRLPCSLAEVALPPPSSLVSGCGSRSINLNRTTHDKTTSLSTVGL